MERSVQKDFFVGDWKVSPLKGLLVHGDETVRLEPKVMEVLVYFASRPNEVVMRDELEREVWRGALVGYDAVTNTVIKLRKALQDDARQPRFIVTIPKMGYQLIASVRQLGEGANDTATRDATGEHPPSPVPQRLPDSSRNRAIALLAAMGVLLGVMLVGLLWRWSADSTDSRASPAIAVLPFENLGVDRADDRLADGITEDIITDLSRLSGVLVMASNTTSAYRGSQVSAAEIGHDLNVRFVLKGSLRRLGDTVRVNAQLVDTETGFNAWAQRYDQKLIEVFAVQNDMTRSIVQALAVKITNQEKARLSRRATDSLQAYDLFQEGQKLATNRTKDAFEQAREAFQAAIALDPNYGRAFGALAVTLAFDFQGGWVDSPVETLDRALVLAKKAVDLDDSVPQTYWALGFVHLMRQDYDNAEASVTQAIRIAPNYADGYGLLAAIHMHKGEPKRALEINAKGMRLNPYYGWQYIYTHGGSYYMLGEYAKAIPLLEEAQSRNPNALYIKLFLAASYINVGRQSDAEWTVNELLAQSPTASLSEIEKGFPVASLGFKQVLLADLRKAGLPE